MFSRPVLKFAASLFVAAPAILLVQNANAADDAQPIKLRILTNIQIGRRPAVLTPILAQPGSTARQT